MRILGLVSVVCLVACSGGPGGGTDGGTSDAGSRKKIVEVTGGVDGGAGGVIYDPLELAWRCLPPDWKTTEPCTNGSVAQAGGPVALPDGGTCAHDYPPCLDGDTFKVEDAIRALSKLPPLQTVPLKFDGSFVVPNVDTTNTTLALVGTVEDPSGKLVYSGYGLGRPPFEDNCDGTVDRQSGTCVSNKPVYVVSREFLEQLATAMGQEYDAILEQGVVIAHVTTADKKTGIKGAKLHHVYGDGTANETTPEVTEGVYYIRNDYTGHIHIESADDPTAVTDESGLIVRLNAGSAKTYTAIIPGEKTVKFERRLNGSRPGTAIEVFFAKCERELQDGCH